MPVVLHYGLPRRRASRTCHHRPASQLNSAVRASDQRETIDTIHRKEFVRTTAGAQQDGQKQEAGRTGGSKAGGGGGRR